MARPSGYKKGEVSEVEYEASHPERLIALMEQGYLDCEICADFNISARTYYRWLHDHPTFRQAHELGLPKCEAWHIRFAKAQMINKEDKGFKWWIGIMNNKFGYKEKEVNNHIQITNNTMNVLQDKSRDELLALVQDQLAEAQIIPLKELADQSESEFTINVEGRIAENGGSLNSIIRED